MGEPNRRVVVDPPTVVVETARIQGVPVFMEVSLLSYLMTNLGYVYVDAPHGPCAGMHLADL